jgi:hypothetical protein
MAMLLPPNGRERNELRDSWEFPTFARKQVLRITQHECSEQCQVLCVMGRFWMVFIQLSQICQLTNSMKLSPS